MILRKELFVAVALFGCSASQPRTLTGQIIATDYNANAAVVIAQSASGARYLSHVSPTGAFQITVPAGERVQLMLADARAQGPYAALSSINFRTAASSTQWIALRPGAPISLGLIRPVGASTSTPTGLGTASAELEDSETEVGDDDGQPDDVKMCGAAAMGDSETEKSVDAAEQDDGAESGAGAEMEQSESGDEASCS